MKALASGLYAGIVSHRRVRPRPHRFRYDVCYALFDLDELSRLDRELLFFGYNRPNLFSIYDHDHLNSDAGPLRAKVDRLLRRAGIENDGGAVRLLCLPRVFGYVFNPISVYFCADREGALIAILYEVNNTFGQKHVYLFSVREQQGRIVQSCQKRLHVSPFMDMELSYHFRIRPPGARMVFNIDAHDSQGLILATGFSGKRGDLSDRRLLRLAFAYPLMTLKVIAAIHFEALRLWLKGVRLRPSPGEPKQSVSLIHSPKSEIET